MLFFSLLSELSGAVTVEMDDKHAERSWKGPAPSGAAVRDALAAIEQPLVALGGVQIMVFTPSDQLTLNPVRELFIYSQSDRWANVLEGKGIKEQRLVRTKSWKFARHGEAPGAGTERARRARGDRAGAGRRMTPLVLALAAARRISPAPRPSHGAPAGACARSRRSLRSPRDS